MRSREDVEIVKLAIDALNMAKDNVAVRVALENLKEIVEIEKARHRANLH